MKTKRPDRSTVRTTSCTFACSHDEKRKIFGAANSLGMSISTFVRMAVIEKLNKGE